MSRRVPAWAAPSAVAAAVRLAAVLLSAREVADVLRYRKVGAHLLDVSWNPYLAPRLYPYPPVWMWWEAASEWLARQGGLPFAVAVKLPVVAADVLIVAVLARLTAGSDGAARLAPWLYALHPVSILVTGAHGQFDALALLGVMAALLLLRDGRADASALALGAAIAMKSFPVVLLPLLALERPGVGPRVRYAALAALPVAALLAPFAVHDGAAVARELFGYGGVADFGWIGAVRGLRYAMAGRLARGEAAYWPSAVLASKALFLAALAALCVARARGWRAGDPAAACRIVLVSFLVLYGALSAQYLLWVVPLALLVPSRGLALYSVAATVALCGFYAFLAPGVLFPVDPGTARGTHAAGLLWAAGAVAVWVTATAWLSAELRSGLPSPARSRRSP